jgi:hypothetical protein
MQVTQCFNYIFVIFVLQGKLVELKQLSMIG